MKAEIQTGGQDRLQRAAIAERASVETELRRLDHELEDLAAQARKLQTRQQKLQDRLRILRVLLGADTSQSGATAATDRARTEDRSHLRGVQIREFAVRILAGDRRGKGPIHYRAWYRLLSERGILVSGKNPEASFLTQISRSPVVRRGSRPGTYYLDYAFPERAQERLDQLRTAFSRSLITGAATSGEIHQAQVRREELAREIRAVERALREARRSLGLADAEPVARQVA